MNFDMLAFYSEFMNKIGDDQSRFDGNHPGTIAEWMGMWLRVNGCILRVYFMSIFYEYILRVYFTSIFYEYIL